MCVCVRRASVSLPHCRSHFVVFCFDRKVSCSSNRVALRILGGGLRRTKKGYPPPSRRSVSPKRPTSRVDMLQCSCFQCTLMHADMRTCEHPSAASACLVSLPARNRHCRFRPASGGRQLHVYQQAPQVRTDRRCLFQSAMLCATQCARLRCNSTTAVSRSLASAMSRGRVVVSNILLVLTPAKHFYLTSLASARGASARDETGLPASGCPALRRVAGCLLLARKP